MIKSSNWSNLWTDTRRQHLKLLVLKNNLNRETHVFIRCETGRLYFNFSPDDECTCIPTGTKPRQLSQPWKNRQETNMVIFIMQLWEKWLSKISGFLKVNEMSQTATSTSRWSDDPSSISKPVIKRFIFIYSLPQVKPFNVIVQNNKHETFSIICDQELTRAQKERKTWASWSNGNNFTVFLDVNYMKWLTIYAC